MAISEAFLRASEDEEDKYDSAPVTLGNESIIVSTDFDKAGILTPGLAKQKICYILCLSH